MINDNTPEESLRIKRVNLLNLMLNKIKTGRNNANLFDDVIHLYDGVGLDMNKKVFSSVKVFKTVFECLSNKTIKPQQIENYEKFLSLFGDWIGLTFKDFNGLDLMDSSTSFEPKNAGSIRLSLRCMALMLRDFNVNSSVNNANLTLLQSLCYGNSFKHQVDVIKHLVEVERVDVNVKSEKHGKAIHLLNATASHDAFKRILVILVDAGADPEETLHFMPFMNVLSDRTCVSYVDFIDELEVTYKKSAGLKGFFYETVHENNMFLKNMIAVKGVVNNIEPNTQRLNSRVI